MSLGANFSSSFDTIDFDKAVRGKFVEFTERIFENKSK